VDAIYLIRNTRTVWKLSNVEGLDRLAGHDAGYLDKRGR
jgi:hypothetical protein